MHLKCTKNQSFSMVKVFATCMEELVEILNCLSVESRYWYLLSKYETVVFILGLVCQGIKRFHG